MLRKVCSVLSPNIMAFSSSVRLPVAGKMLISTNIQPMSNFSSLVPKTLPFCQNLSQGSNKIPISKALLELKPVTAEQRRTIVKFSWKSGEREAHEEVPARFFRLRWGGWIRVLAGRRRCVWKKSRRERSRAMQHFLVDHLQSVRLEKMITRHWRRPRYYPEDPYEPYHTRNYCDYTRKGPWRPEGVDYE